MTIIFRLLRIVVVPPWHRVWAAACMRGAEAGDPSPVRFPARAPAPHE